MEFIRLGGIMSRRYPRLQTEIIGKSLTQQEYKEECDVNNVIRRYQLTGDVNLFNRTEGQYIDVSDVKDFQESMNIVRQAQQTFEALPAKVRAELANNPENLLKLVEQVEQGDEIASKIAIKLGLATKKELSDGKTSSMVNDDSSVNSQGDSAAVSN